MYLISDLSLLTTAKEVQNLADGLKNIDIGILILNAGIGVPGPFIGLTP